MTPHHSPHPEGTPGDGATLTDQIRRATSQVREDDRTARMCALPGPTYWTVATATGVAVVATWVGLLVGASQDDTGRIGYGEAILLAVTAVATIAMMTTIAIGALAYLANRREARLTALLERQHQEVMENFAARDQATYNMGFWAGSAQTLRDAASVGEVTSINHRRTNGATQT